VSQNQVLGRIRKRYLHVYRQQNKGLFNEEVDYVGFLELHYFLCENEDLSINEKACLLYIPRLGKFALAVKFPHKKRELKISIIPPCGKGMTIEELLENIYGKWYVPFERRYLYLETDTLEKPENVYFKETRLAEDITRTGTSHHTIVYYLLNPNAVYRINFNFKYYFGDRVFIAGEASWTTILNTSFPPTFKTIDYQEKRF